MEPLVSVCIWTYNQENYIRACVEGALKQRTTFKIEVIVGNDCSPDGTRDILDDLAEEYPDRLIAINRPQNIGGHKNSMDVIARARGEFVAFCDGDDYWIDPLKLQKQYDALQRHPNVDLCFHPAKEYRNEKFHSLINNYYDSETIIPLEKVIEGRGGYMPTASLMIRKSAIYPFPECFVENAPVGDTFIQALGSARGGGLFLPHAMNVYRRFTQGSITSMNRKKNVEASTLVKKYKGYCLCYAALTQVLGSTKAIDRACLSQAIELIGHALRVKSYEAACLISKDTVSRFRALDCWTFKHYVFLSTLPYVSRLLRLLLIVRDKMRVS
jgi:glycosyltransferase involved in cell wall biosynthesis